MISDLAGGITIQDMLLSIQKVSVCMERHTRQFTSVYIPVLRLAEVSHASDGAKFELPVF